MALKFDTAYDRYDIECMLHSTIRMSNYTLVSCLDDSFMLFLDNDDTSLTPSITEHGYWEAWITSWHTRNVGSGTTYIDFGANVGYYSLLAASLGAEQVYSFEPNRDTYELLDSALTEYSTQHSHVHFYPLDKAFGSANEFRYLDREENNLGGIALGDIYETQPEDKWGIKRDDVTGVLKLDSHFDVYPPKNKIGHVWKLDVEGHEEQLLLGAEQAMKDYQPVLLLEWTPNAYSDDFYSFLENYGRVYLLNFDGFTETPWYDVDYLNSGDWKTLVVRPHA